MPSSDISHEHDFQTVDLSILLSDRSVQQLLDIADQHPEWSMEEMVRHHPKNTAGEQVFTYTDARAILGRLHLSTATQRRIRQVKTKEWEHANKPYRQRLISQTIPDFLSYITQRKQYQQNRRNTELPVFKKLPLEVQQKYQSYDKFFSLSKLFAITFVLSLSTLFIGSLVFDSLFQAVGILAKIGMFFAFSALFFGLFFFLYSLKYYFTVALVLSYSRSADEDSSERHGWSSFFRRIFGVSVEITTENSSPPLADKHYQPSLSYNLLQVQLERQPFVSIQVGTYNEKRVIDRFLLAATSMDYENYEVIVADDSTDETVSLLDKWAAHPRVKISHRATRQGYKGAALKEALKKVDPCTEFILIFDADFIPYPDVIRQFLKYYQSMLGSLDPSTIASSSIAAIQGYQWHVLNKSENWITRGVRTEYSGSYIIERSGVELYQGLKQISGSVYMIRSDVLRQVEWGSSITEDFELTLKLYEQGFKVVYTPYIQAPAEAVSTVKRLIRQRMRWAEGHSFNVKKMFKRLLLSPHLSRSEKFEFVYLTPYYLQAFFFLLGTFCWFTSEVVFQTRLPFWTEVWGWSLVITNLLSIPLMNMVGLFMEDSEEHDYLGLLSFVVLSYLVAPFQAFAALKGFLEKEEGPWFRTPKTGRITDSFVPGRFFRFVRGILGKGNEGFTVQNAKSRQPDGQVKMQNEKFEFNGEMNLHSATVGNRVFSQKRPYRWRGKSIIALLLLCTMLLNYLSFFPVGHKAEAAWFNSSYLKKKSITIDHTKVSGGSDLSNFPVLISLTDPNLKTTGNGGNVQNSSGFDIIFTGSSENAKLDHEIEKYVSSTGEIEMWVRVPTLSAITDTILYMYYDNASISSSQENKTGVWDTNYKGVWHLKETSGTQFDSSSNGNNLSAVLNASTQGSATGKIDGADSFVAGSGKSVEAADATTLTPTNLTLQAWVDFSSFSVTANDYTIVKKVNSSGTPTWNSYVLSVDQNKHAHFEWDNTSGTSYNVYGSTALTTGTWYLITGIYDSSANKIYVYVNGANDSGTGTTTTGSIFDSNANLLIGDANNTYTPDSINDESKLSSVIRSTGWLTTEYSNQNSPSTFYIVSSESTNSTAPTIEQQINILNTAITASNNASLALIDTAAYSGTVTYYFEVDALVTSGTGTVDLTYNAGTGTKPAGGSVVTISNINTTSYARYRSASFSPTGAQNIYISGMTGTGTSILAARIIVVQTNATLITDTQTQIEVGKNDNSIVATTDTAFGNPKFWKWDASKYDGTVTVYFEASIRNTTGGDANAASLYPAGTSCSGQVSGSEVTSDTTTAGQRIRSGDISANLSSGTTYMVCARAITGGAVQIRNAKIIVKQTAASGLAKMELQHVYVNTSSTNNTSSYVSQKYLNQYDPADWTGGTFTYFFESNLKTNNTSNAAFAQLYNTTDSSAISSSEVSHSGDTTNVLVRSGSLTMPTSAKDMDTQIKNASTSTSTVTGSWLVIDVSSLQTPEHLAFFFPLIIFLPKIVEYYEKRKREQKYG